MMVDAAVPVRPGPAMRLGRDAEGWQSAELQVPAVWRTGDGHQGRAGRAGCRRSDARHPLLKKVFKRRQKVIIHGFRHRQRQHHFSCVTAAACLVGSVLKTFFKTREGPLARAHRPLTELAMTDGLSARQWSAATDYRIRKLSKGPCRAPHHITAPICQGTNS